MHVLLEVDRKAKAHRRGKRPKESVYGSVCVYQPVDVRAWVYILYISKQQESTVNHASLQY
jgi:hypothetical protein